VTGRSSSTSNIVQLCHTNHKLRRASIPLYVSRHFSFSNLYACSSQNQWKHELHPPTSWPIPSLAMEESIPKSVTDRTREGTSSSMRLRAKYLMYILRRSLGLMHRIKTNALSASYQIIIGASRKHQRALGVLDRSRSDVWSYRPTCIYYRFSIDVRVSSTEPSLPFIDTLPPCYPTQAVALPGA
jgi:hypothetical protein